MMATSVDGSNQFVSGYTIEKVNKTKMTLENYYSNLIGQHEERETRFCHNLINYISKYI